MLRKIDLFIVGLVFVLGIAHTLSVFMFFELRFSPDATDAMGESWLWWAYGGFGVCALAVLNYYRIKFGEVSPLLYKVCIVANAATLLFAFLLVISSEFLRPGRVALCIITAILFLFSVHGLHQWYPKKASPERYGTPIEPAPSVVT